MNEKWRCFQLGRRDSEFLCGWLFFMLFVGCKFYVVVLKLPILFCNCGFACLNYMIWLHICFLHVIGQSWLPGMCCRGNGCRLRIDLIFTYHIHLQCWFQHHGWSNIWLHHHVHSWHWRAEVFRLNIGNSHSCMIIISQRFHFNHLLI